jgi:hypothetical protein
MNRFTILVFAGLALWIVETAMFGFNDKPGSGQEKMLDQLSMILIWWGIIGDILSGVTVQKINQFVNKKENMK